MKYDAVIIDPASTEFNRGSFCYLPYILYSGLKENKRLDICLLENFTVAEIDNIPEAVEYYIALWSTPQIEICTVLKRFLKGRVRFFGYTPLIEEFHFPVEVIGNPLIEKGIINYPKYYKDFKYLLLSDCDMHLSKYEGQVYPLCTSYGCPKGCNFCPSTVNCEKKRVVPDSIEDVFGMIDTCIEQEIRSIHFTDEDFFWNAERTHFILEYIKHQGIRLGVDFQLIAMAHVGTLLKFIDEYGVQIIDEAGMKLIEVGFETADEKLAFKMGKLGVTKHIELAGIFQGVDCNIFWLTLTFFPGETITTLNATGLFLRDFGYDLNDLYGRIQTNSTHGGLGQFFQFYPGTKDYENKNILGLNITDRAIRLIPSFIPNSFLYDTIKSTYATTFDEKWFNLYNLPKLPEPHYFNGKKIGEALCQMVEVDKICTIEEGATYLAICCRLGIITSQ